MDPVGREERKGEWGGRVWREGREGRDGRERGRKGRGGMEGREGERGWTVLTQSIDGSRLAAC